MKKKNILTGQIFNREDLKKITGGLSKHKGAPAEPIPGGLSVGMFKTNVVFGTGAQCCWKDEPSNCSACVSGADSSWTCVASAVNTACAT